ncbi:dihydrofolate reductase family protein [Sphingobacterium litopenaei]|uniref:Dihydrofolate reductase family protein n=1 Tax=Sphingobacterium litopenaei TaxID=2763500 RepID=A0ABR7YGH8_9SPHI|nr:dihydrofolate reductase family protein [Sphingobacterium litopenaei]MBD1430420.1 dihydrofolate reductase family protein [Sphingobacterium litopenaei]
MGNIICAINMTIDGNFDHIQSLPDEHVHAYYANLLKKGTTILYGRKTYELMLYWKDVLKNKNSDFESYAFAKTIHAIRKIIFSNTLQSTNWSTAQLADSTLIETIKNLKEEKDALVYIGSRSLMLQLLALKLIDEIQLCIHPMVSPTGRLLFEGLENQIVFKQKLIKTLPGGHIVLSLLPIY